MSGNLGSIARTSIILLLAVIFIFFFFKFLPVILVLGIAVFGFLKIKSLIRKKKEFNTAPEDVIADFDKKYDLKNKQVIDVEYYEEDVYKQNK